MTPQEEQLLNSLVERVNQTQLQEKDPDAEALLNRELGSNTDALYILAQTILVQNIGLEQAKAQVNQLQQQVQQLQQARQPARATSFLGNLLGHHDPPPPPPVYQPVYDPTPQAYVPPPPPPYGYSQPQYVPVMGGPPSFLRGAMQTAAGVAAGALAFEGMEAVLHGIGGFGHPGYGIGGFGMGPGFAPMGMMGGGFERPVEETVINNYYNQPAGGHEHFESGNVEHGVAQHGYDNSGDVPHFHESADQSGAHLTDASYNTIGNDRGSDDLAGLDQGSYSEDLRDDSSNFDNSSLDEGGGFDDGGGGFDSGGFGGGGDLV